LPKTSSQFELFYCLYNASFAVCAVLSLTLGRLIQLHVGTASLSLFRLNPQPKVAVAYLWFTKGQHRSPISHFTELLWSLLTVVSDESMNELYDGGNGQVGNMACYEI